MIGINDIDSGKTAKQVETNYRKILEEIKKNLPETQVYCMSLISQHKKIETYTVLKIANTIPTIMEANGYIQNLSQEFGYTYVDLFHATCDSENALIEKLYGISKKRRGRSKYLLSVNVMIGKNDQKIPA